jgi:2-oxo-4-hydroxy-4-carboxy--5-ureidoimidazoline (OHCU) decarboxylase
MVYNSMSDYLATRDPKQGIRVDQLSSDVNDATLRAFYQSQLKAKYNHPNLCTSQAAKGIASATVNKSSGTAGWDAVKKTFVK